LVQDARTRDLGLPLDRGDQPVSVGGADQITRASSSNAAAMVRLTVSFVCQTVDLNANLEPPGQIGVAIVLESG